MCLFKRNKKLEWGLQYKNALEGCRIHSFAKEFLIRQNSTGYTHDYSALKAIKYSDNS